jgi:hypothetical protein
MRFANKVVLITAGSAGIGLACAHRFASKGAKILNADMRKPTTEAEQKLRGLTGECQRKSAGCNCERARSEGARGKSVLHRPNDTRARVVYLYTMYSGESLRRRCLSVLPCVPSMCRAGLGVTRPCAPRNPVFLVTPALGGEAAAPHMRPLYDVA